MHCFTLIFRRIHKNLSCVITVTVDTLVASLCGHVTCMSSIAPDFVGPSQALADSLHEHRSEILRLDCRIYPSTSMKLGISSKRVGEEPCRNPCHDGRTDRCLEEMLVADRTGGGFSTNYWRTGDPLTQLCRRWTLNHTQCVCFSIRIMASHTWLKYGRHAKSITTGSVISPTVHPPEMVALYSLWELLLLRAQEAVVDESVELEPLSVPRGAGRASAEKAQPLVETPLSLKIPLSLPSGGS